MISVKSSNNGVDLEKIFLRAEEKLPELVKELTETVRKDNEENLNSQRSYDGSALKPLSPEYRKWKQKKLGYTDIFKGKELKLIKSVKSKVTKETGRVWIDKVRDDIMTYLEQGGRKGFGLGERLQTKLRKITENWLTKNIR